MNPVLAVLSVLYLVLLGLLLQVAYDETLFARYAQAKAVVSGGFLLLALAAFAAGTRALGARFWLLLLALLLCAAGDVLLGLANTRGGGAQSPVFLAGMGAFGAAHVAFCAFFGFAVGPLWAELLLPLAMIAATLVLDHRGVLVLGRMRAVSIGYCFLVGLMCSKAAAALAAAGFAGAGPRLAAAGAVLFLLSDSIIIFLYFARRRPAWLRFANLSTYYLGLLLLALSAAH